MYKPAPQRPKKTNIVRSRTGCKACRQRRVKCDEKKPSCSACVRHGKTCETVTPSFDFRTGIAPLSKSHYSRSSKFARVVFTKEMCTNMTVPGPGMDFYASNYVSEEPNCTEDVLALAPLINEECLPGDSLLYQTPVSFTLSPLPSPNVRRSLSRSESELFYLTHWEKSCTQSLPQALKQIMEMANDHAPLKQAVLALSACNMSRSLPENGEEVSYSQVTYRPRREYLLSSQHYYGSAVQQIARSIGKDSIVSPSHTLAVLILFCYFESAMGNFAGFGCHAKGVDAFIQSHFRSISSDHLGRGLTAAWINARNHNWWLRMNFSSFSLQLSQGSLSLTPEISNILHSIHSRRAVVTSILCESYRLSNIALVQLGPCGLSHTDLTVDNCISSLKLESRKLDEWHSALPQSELPIESFPSREPMRENIHPLLFTSHFPAMNYAYYVCCHIMQCTALFHDLRQSHESDEAEEEVAHWMGILLRVVAGLDKQKCFNENVYSIGVSSLLAACLLRCHNLAFGKWIEEWLYEWSKQSILEEGSFPIAQALEVTRLVNQEKAAGNYIYAVALPEDDGGGGGRAAQGDYILS